MRATFLLSVTLLAVGASAGQVPTSSTAPTTQSTQPADGGRQWALDVTNRQLVAAMPADVESIWIKRFPSQRVSAGNERESQTQPAGFDEFRNHVVVLGGSNFTGMPFSFGNYNSRSIVITLDSFAPARRDYESGLADSESTVERISHGSDVVFVRRYVAMEARSMRPELRKTDYSAFLNDYCLVTAESLDELVAMLRKLRDAESEPTASWRELLPPENETTGTTIMRRIETEDSRCQFTSFVVQGEVKLRGFCYTLVSGEPLHFRIRAISADASADARVLEDNLRSQKLATTTTVSASEFTIEVKGQVKCYFASAREVYEQMLFGKIVHGL